MKESAKKGSSAKSERDNVKIEFRNAPVHSITPFLMFNANTEEAAKFYVSIFRNSKIIKADSMQAEFILNGQKFFAYNGGPGFEFSWGVSFMISVETQEEVDYYWNALLADGGKESMCGWLQDRFGMWWQVTPKILLELIFHKDPEKAKRSTEAMMKMHKINISALRTAASE